MKVLVLTGPTGVGKTEVAERLAGRFGLELISADSRQVYCWLDIGTDKPSRAVRERVRFHMVDKVEHDRSYSAADFGRDALAVMRRLHAENKRFIVVGGSGMYIRAIFQPFFDAPRADPKLRQSLESLPTPGLWAMLKAEDPKRAAQLHPNDRQRIIRALEIKRLTGKRMSDYIGDAGPGNAQASTGAGAVRFIPVYVALDAPRDILHRRIDERFDRMMEQGLLDEVRMLREHGFGLESYVANAYGYSELLEFIEGRRSLPEAVEAAKAKSRAYARRQLTWCRKLDNARWVSCLTADQAVKELEPLVSEVLSGA